MLGKLRRFRVVHIGQTVLRRFSDNGGNNMSAAVAYYGFLSLFPLLLLALALIGFVLAGDVDAQRQWVERLSQAIPGIGQIIGKSVRVVVEGRGAVGVIGLAGLAWTGAGIVNAAGTALNRIYRVPGYGSFLRQRLWQFGTLAVLGTLALLAVIVTGTVAAIERSGLLGMVLRIAPALLGLGLDFVLFMLSYRLLTQRRGPPFRKLWVGATFAATGWTILKLAGGWYAERVVSGATAVYGTFAAVVGVLALLHLSARLLLYGAEINAVLIEEKGGGPMSERDPRKGMDQAIGNGERAPRARSTPDLIMSIAGDTSALVRKEMELARQEMVEAVTGRLRTVGSLIVAGVLGLFVLGWLASALASALDGVLVPWASRLIVAGIFLLLAGVAIALGRGSSKAPLEETKRTIKEDVEWARAQLKR